MNVYYSVEKFKTDITIFDTIPIYFIIEHQGSERFQIGQPFTESRMAKFVANWLNQAHTEADENMEAHNNAINKGYKGQ